MRPYSAREAEGALVCAELCTEQKEIFEGEEYIMHWWMASKSGDTTNSRLLMLTSHHLITLSMHRVGAIRVQMIQADQLDNISPNSLIKDRPATLGYIVRNEKSRKQVFTSRSLKMQDRDELEHASHTISAYLALSKHQ